MPITFKVGDRVIARGKHGEVRGFSDSGHVFVLIDGNRDHNYYSPEELTKE